MSEADLTKQEMDQARQAMDAANIPKEYRHGPRVVVTCERLTAALEEIDRLHRLWVDARADIERLQTRTTHLQTQLTDAGRRGE